MAEYYCLFTHAILDSCTMKTRMNCREIHNTMYGEIGSELHIIEIEGKGSYCHAILRVFSPFSMIMFCQRALVLFDQFRLDRALASQPGPSQLIELTINRPITNHLEQSYNIKDVDPVCDGNDCTNQT